MINLKENVARVAVVIQNVFLGVLKDRLVPWIQGVGLQLTFKYGKGLRSRHALY